MRLGFYIRRASEIFTGILMILSIAFVLWNVFEDAEDCLARNIWFESAYEPYEGQRAVGLVTALRTVSGEYPASVCATVYQRVQFSWTLDPRKAFEVIKNKSYQDVKRLAREILELRKDPVAVRQSALALGLPPDAYFYKRLDNIRVSARGKRFFDLCTTEVKDPKDPTGTKQLVIGAHAFYRPRPDGCIKPPAPKPFEKKAPKKK